MNRHFSENSEDHICSICLRIYFDPQTTPCAHTFCRRCAVKNLQKNHPKCPMCRADLTEWLPELQPFDEEYAAFLKRTFAKDLHDREQEDAEEKAEEKYLVLSTFSS